jgi:hypothetical protein
MDAYAEASLPLAAIWLPTKASNEKGTRNLSEAASQTQ